MQATAQTATATTDFGSRYADVTAGDAMEASLEAQDTTPYSWGDVDPAAVVLYPDGRARRGGADLVDPFADTEQGGTALLESVISPFGLSDTRGMFDTPLTAGVPCPKCSRGRLVADSGWLECNCDGLANGLCDFREFQGWGN